MKKKQIKDLKNSTVFNDEKKQQIVCEALTYIVADLLEQDKDGVDLSYKFKDLLIKFRIELIDIIDETDGGSLYGTNDY